MKLVGNGLKYSVVAVLTVGLALLLSLCQCTPKGNSRGEEFDNSNSVASAYSDLDGWGYWVSDARFGEVWCPDVEEGWTPFSDGYWTWTDQGWLWVSYESYGWLVYHYGNWYYNRENGWFWVPGDVWSPAAVTWVAYDDYVCWAPTPPLGGSWSDPWESGSGQVIPWTVVHASDFTQNQMQRFAVHVDLPAVTSETTVERKPPTSTFIADRTRTTLTPAKFTRQPVSAGRKTLFKAVVAGPGKHKETPNRDKPKAAQKPTATKVSKVKKGELKQTPPKSETKPEASKVEKKPGLLPVENPKEADSTKIELKRPKK